MKIATPTKLKVAPLAGRLDFPKHSVTWIVKGTFDLKPNGPVVLAEKQTFPTGEEFYPDDTEKTGGPRYESDFAYRKPLADVLLVGACYAPEGKPTQRCQATFRVGDKSKTIEVVGNRRWQRRMVSWDVSEAQPFTRMELRYENSFGGEKFAANPVGKGFAELTNEAGERLWPLPNIEDPAHLIQSRGNRPAPAGFGPLSRMWELRHEMVGSYKGEYRKTRWPWFPTDFDWRYFNAAPPDMQVNGFLRGDEKLSFQNLHPKHAVYESQLPGLRVRCFVHRFTGAKPGELRFDEVEMKLDTLWVDLEAEKLVLLWRGWSAVSSEEHEEIRDFYFVTEPLAQPPAPLERHYLEFMAFQGEALQPFEPEEPPPPPGTPPPGPDPAAEEAARKKAKEETLKEFQEHAAVINAQFGLDWLSPEAQKEARDAQTKLMARLAENDPAKSGEMAEAAQREELRKILKNLGLDLDNLPALSDQARAQQAQLMTELGLGPDAQQDKTIAELASILGAVFVVSKIDLQKFLTDIKLKKKELGLDEPEQPPVPEPEPAAPPLTRESVQAKMARRESLEGADLRGLNLSELDLKEIDLTGANLSNVSLRKANLQGAILAEANFTKADLTEANLTRANVAGADFSEATLRQAKLNEADLAGAKFAKANLTKAVLDGAVLEEADLSGACLVECSALGTIFCGANMAGASFRKGLGAKADFSKATLSQADFQEANLTEACVIGAIGHQLNLPGAVLTKLRAGGCDFTGAKLNESKGNGSLWKGANLTGADFRFAWMEEAMFTAACLKQSNLSAANMKFSKFKKADLTEAKLIQMNLFQGNLAKANLTNTDFSGSNLYEADFLDATLDHTKIAGANIKMTKLEAA